MDSSSHLFLGVPLSPLTLDESVTACVELVEAARPAQHVVLNASKTVLMEDDAQLKAIIRECDIVNADGMSVVWAARFLGIKVPERVAGIDLMERLLGEAADRDWPVYLLGARPETISRFAEVVKSTFPSIEIAGYRDGYFDDDAGVARAVRDSQARLLLVGISSPRKEYFLAENLRHMGPLLAMGVGGSFEVWVGNAKRAPVWMQDMGLEWFYRLIQEPGRMWRRYLIGNVRFVGIVLKARFAPHK